ncbi:MAG: DUF5074 domain-containing protein [Flavobacteriales bacterium]
MNTINRNSIFIFASIIVLSSCKKDNVGSTTEGFTDGVFVVNEGNYLGNNASISYINEQDVLTQDPYSTVNGNTVGDVLQCFVHAGDKAYAVMNGSEKVVGIDMNSFSRVAEFTGLEYPRYAAVYGSNTLLVSDGFTNGRLVVFDRSSNQALQSVPVGIGPERVFVYGNRVFVLNAASTTVSVIDPSNWSVAFTIALSDHPSDMVADAQGNLWFLCSGETLYDANWNIIGHTDAQMHRVDGTTLEWQQSWVVGTGGQHPRDLERSPNGETLYYTGNQLMRFSSDFGPDDAEVLVDGGFYAITVDQSSGDLWAVLPSDYINRSTIRRYSASGSLEKTFQAGMVSNAVVLRP